MDNAKKAALAAIDEKNELIAEVADSIWDYAELSMQEVKSAALFVKVLKEEGFQVEEGICGIPTAFSASYGSGKPVIGFLAEYDALSGLSQEAGSTEYHELVKGGSGHGCGHNLLGAGAMAAAIGLKHYLAGTGKSGTVILYGCPGEEGVASKAYMARDGLWYNLDAALTWHAGDCNEVATGSTNSCIQMLYTFHGLASQASTAPERGRSALDAVELMNVGVQFLREHMPRDARIHYSILDAGGASPNVVQHQASVLYMIRSNFVKDCITLHQRVDKIAQGAALMTDTTIERRFVDGLSDTVCNHALEKVLYDNFTELGVPACTPEEHAFMEKLSATYAGSDIPQRRRRGERSRLRREGAGSADRPLQRLSGAAVPGSRLQRRLHRRGRRQLPVPHGPDPYGGVAQPRALPQLAGGVLQQDAAGPSGHRPCRQGAVRRGH